MNNSTSNLLASLNKNNMETLMTNSSLQNDNEANDLVGANTQQQQHHHLLHLQHQQEANNELEDIDSTDDLDDDELDYKRGSNANMSSSNQAGSCSSQTSQLFLEDDKRKRRAIANSNERRRMQSINAGFQTLKSLIPHSSGEKLSKACILQRSADFMQYLSNEKEKLSVKVQLAIKILETNGLLSQFQAQINSTLDTATSSHYAGLASSNSSGLLTGSKSASCTKINKQSCYLSNMTNQSVVNTTADSPLTKPIHSNNIQQQTESDLLAKSASTTTTTKANSQDLNVSPNVNTKSSTSPHSPPSTSPSLTTTSTITTTTTTTNRKSTQISSLLNTLGSASIALPAVVNTSNLDQSTSGDCKSIQAPVKNTATTTPVVKSATLGPSSSYTASSSSSSSSSSSCSSPSSSSSSTSSSCANDASSKSTCNKLSTTTSTTNLISKLQTTVDEIKLKDEHQHQQQQQARAISIVNTNQIIPATINNRQLTDTTNIKPLQPILITNSSFNQNNLIQASNLLISSNTNDTYSIYDASTNHTSLLSLNPSCNLEDLKLSEHSSLLIATTTTTTSAPSDTIVSGEHQFSEGNLANLVLIGADGTTNNADLLKIITPIHLKDDKNVSKLNSNKLISSKLKQENTYFNNHHHHHNPQSIDLIGMLNDLSKTKSSSPSLVDSSKQMQIDSKVSPTSHSALQLEHRNSTKIKNIKPIILNKLINSDDKTISQFLKNKSVHSDYLMESFNEMENVYDEDENIRNLSDSDFNSDPNNNIQQQQQQQQIEQQPSNHNFNHRNVKISKTIQNLISMSKNAPSSKQTDVSLVKSKEDFIKSPTSAIIKSSRSNSIDQLIAAASACMSPLSPSHSPPVSSNQTSSISSPNTNVSSNFGLNEHVDTDTTSLSRKNLNTIVEAIFHVEGKLLEQLEETPASNDTTSNEQVTSSTCLTSRTQNVSSSSSLSSSGQQQKPPKKRKYTTEETINAGDLNATKDDLTHTSTIPNKQAYSNQYISEYYNSNNNNNNNNTAKTNQYENINKLLSNSNKSPVRLNQNDLILNQSLLQTNNDKNEVTEAVNHYAMGSGGKTAASTFCSNE